MSSFKNTVYAMVVCGVLFAQEAYECVDFRDIAGSYRPYALAIDDSDSLYSAGTPGCGGSDSLGSQFRKWNATGDMERFMPDGLCTCDRTLEGLAADGQGYLYATSGSTIYKIASDANGTVSDEWCLVFDYPCTFWPPEMHGIAINRDQSILYFADAARSHIRLYSLEGQFLGTFGESGRGPGQLRYPKGLAVDPQGFIYVAEYGNYRISKFDPQGNFIVCWGTLGREPGQFVGPTGVAVDKNGFVYVTDYFANRVQRFDSDGNFVAMWGQYGSEPGDLIYPQGITIDTHGAVYVACASGVHKFSRTTYFTRGDANGDTSVNIADATFILGYLFGSGAPPVVIDAADVNDDGKVNVSDAVYLLQYLFSGSGTIPPPFPASGADPTADDLFSRI